MRPLKLRLVAEIPTSLSLSKPVPKPNDNNSIHVSHKNTLIKTKASFLAHEQKDDK